MEPTTTAALIGAGGSLLGGLIGSSGQSSANRTNLQIARETNAFQERMSNTAYQRSANDLEKAGLNRILALGSPASSPSGNVATMQNAKKQLGEAVSASARQAAEIGLIKAQTKKANAEANIKSPLGNVMDTVNQIINMVNKEGKKVIPQLPAIPDKVENLVKEAKQSGASMIDKAEKWQKENVPFVHRIDDIKKDKEGFYVMDKGKKIRFKRWREATFYITNGILPNHGGK